MGYFQQMMAILAAGPRGFTSPGNYYFASNRTKTPGGVLSVTGNNKMLVRVYLGTAPFDSHSYRFGLPGHTNTTLGQYPTEANLTAEITIDGVAMGHGASTDPTAATWIAGTIDGAAGGTIATTNRVGILTDDIVSPSSPIPAGNHRWLQIALSTSSGVSIPQVYQFTPSTSPAIEGTVRGTSTYSATSNIAITPGAVPSTAYGPSFVVCKGHQGRPVVLGWGDSIMTSLNEQPEAYTLGVSSFFSRGMEAATKKTFGANIAVPGSGPHQWTHSGRDFTVGAKIDLIKLVSALQGGLHPFTHIVSEHGTNSVNGLSANTTGTAGTPNASTTGNTADATSGVAWNTPSGFLAGMKAYADLLRAEFGSTMPIWQTTVIAKGGTTTGWTTLAGQAPNAATVAQGFGFNTALASNLADGKFAGLIDTAAAAGDASDTTKWKVHPFQTTLASDYTSGAATMVLTSVDGLAVGDGIVIDPLGSGSTQSTGGSYVTAINVGTKTVTITGARSYSATAGAQVNGQHTRDGTHPNTSMHKLMAVPVSEWVDALTGSIP